MREEKVNAEKAKAVGERVRVIDLVSEIINLPNYKFTHTFAISKVELLIASPNLPKRSSQEEIPPEKSSSRGARRQIPVT